MKYIVTAYDTRLGYRNTVTKPLTYSNAVKIKKQLQEQNKIAVTKFYNKLVNIKIEMATKKRTKKSATKRKDSCAVSLGRKGGKRTLALGHGIFADVYRKKRKAKKSAAKRRTTRKRK